MATLTQTIAGLFSGPKFALPGADAVSGVPKPVTDSLSRAKNWFFHEPAVTRRMDEVRHGVLLRVGAAVMREARKSIKPRLGPSAPGSPPHAHRGYDGVSRKTGKKKKFFSFRDSIIFAYDPFRETVVIGPYKFNGSRTNPTVPELHEFGGTVPGNGRVAWILNPVGRDSKGRYTTNGYTRVVLNGPVRYPARPYMRPALNRIAAKDRFAGLFRDSF